MTSAFLRILAVAAVATAGCVERTSYETQDGSEKVAKLLLEKPPAISHRLDADFDGKVVLLGYDVDTEEVSPGGKVRVTWYWECKQSPGAGWRLFTHVLDAEGKSKINKDAAGPIRKHFQPEHWRPGTFVEDPIEISLPKGWTSSEVNLRVGLWKDRERMKPRTGPIDDENRVKGPAIRVSGREEGRPVNIPKAALAPKIDGEFEAEEAWAGALVIPSFVGTMDGEPVGFETTARLMWDDENLYVAVTAVDDYLQSKFTEHDDELWHEDAFELFLDPAGDRKNYYEIQINPAGVVFDSYLPRYRKNTNEWSSKAVVAAKIDGTLNDGQGGDVGWRAELAIPFASLASGDPMPPKTGDTWRVNFFRVDATQSKPRYSAWSPPLRGDFHALDRFGLVRFKGPARESAAKASDAGVSKRRERDGGPR